MGVWKLEITLDDNTVFISGSTNEVKEKLKTDVEWDKQIGKLHVVVTFTANGFDKWFGRKVDKISRLDDLYTFDSPISASTAVEGVFQSNNIEFLLQ